MTQLGWTPAEVKWGGRDFTKLVWTENGYAIGQGKVTGPNGYRMKITDHFNQLPYFEAIGQRGYHDG